MSCKVAGDLVPGNTRQWQWNFLGFICKERSVIDPSSPESAYLLLVHQETFVLRLTQGRGKDGRTEMRDLPFRQISGENDIVFLTGASGFVGRHILHALLAAQYRVRVLLRPGSQPLPPDERCTTIWGNILHAGELVPSMVGCRYLIHAAALYSFAPGMRQDIFATNVRGCAGILEAAHLAGIERAVVTSSSSTVGPAQNGHPASEVDWDAEESPSVYHRSKLQQARVALAAQVPSILILPTAPVGSGDWKPTPTGKMIVDFLRGRICATLSQPSSTKRSRSAGAERLAAVQSEQFPAPEEHSSGPSMESGLNIVAVEDVARAHILALQHGRPHSRYLVGCENVSLSQLWMYLANICGRPAPTRRIPFRLALALSLADELRCQLFRPISSKIMPLVPLEGVRMAQHQMYVDSTKAQTELGYTATSVTVALEQAVQWYYDNGYVK